MLIKYEFVNGDTVTVKTQGDEGAVYLEALGIKPEHAKNGVNVVEHERKKDRKHHRVHKYTGLPVSFEAACENGEEITYGPDEFSRGELCIDLVRALENLTNMQRFCFIEVCVRNRTHRSVAKVLNKSKTAISQAVDGARKKLKKSLAAYDQTQPPAAIR